LISTSIFVGWYKRPLCKYPIWNLINTNNNNNIIIMQVSNMEFN
jgi:hypothetical protein